MSTSFSNPLIASHERANAESQPYADVQIVSTFGQPQAEYAAIHKACGVMDLPQRGIIQATGKDRLTFLNNLLTNQVWDKQTKTPIAAGKGVYAFLLNAKSGRIIVDVNVLELGDRTLLELDARLIPQLLETLERYRFAEQIKLESRVGALHEIALHGPGALEILKLSIDPLPAMGEPITCGTGRIIGQEVIVWRDDPTGLPGYHLIVPTSAADAIWNHLLVRFGSNATDTLRAAEGLPLPAHVQEALATSERVVAPHGKRLIRPVGWAAFNACRIEAGRAIFGIDFDDSILPAETGQMHRAVSLTKGCYPGQEIVARMHARQQWGKQLVGIKMSDTALPIAGAQIYDEAGNGIGAITSSTISPILSGAAVCLGIVKRPRFAIGSKLTIPAEGKMREATVVEVPFK